MESTRTELEKKKPATRIVTGWKEWNRRTALFLSRKCFECQGNADIATAVLLGVVLVVVIAVKAVTL